MARHVKLLWLKRQQAAVFVRPPSRRPLWRYVSEDERMQMAREDARNAREERQALNKPKIRKGV